MANFDRLIVNRNYSNSPGNIAFTVGRIKTSNFPISREFQMFFPSGISAGRESGGRLRRGIQQQRRLSYGRELQSDPGTGGQDRQLRDSQVGGEFFDLLRGGEHETTGRKVRRPVRAGAFAYLGCLGRFAAIERRPRLESQDSLFSGRGKWHFMQSRK